MRSSRQSQPFNYNEEIQNKINGLNLLAAQPNYDTDRVKAILFELQELDAQKLKDDNHLINNQILFTRHGEAEPWREKKWGLAPNSAISDSALGQMQQSNRYTSALIYGSLNSIDVYVSPMVRAKQTASKLIPDGVKANIRIEASLSENSKAPSGANISSDLDLKYQYDDISFSQSPLKKLFFKLSAWSFGSQAAFDGIQARLKQADDRLSLSQRNHNLSLDSSSIIALGPHEKISHLSDSIAHNSNIDNIWLFGHGKNFKAFFKQIFRIQTSFDYAETKRIYQVENLSDQSKSIFCPSYSLVVDQKSGRLLGKYLPLQEKLALTPFEINEDTTLAMQEKFQQELNTKNEHHVLYRKEATRLMQLNNDSLSKMFYAKLSQLNKFRNKLECTNASNEFEQAITKQLRKFNLVCSKPYGKQTKPAFIFEELSNKQDQVKALMVISSLINLIRNTNEDNQQRFVYSLKKIESKSSLGAASPLVIALGIIALLISAALIATLIAALAAASFGTAIPVVSALFLANPWTTSVLLGSAAAITAGIGVKTIHSSSKPDQIIQPLSKMNSLFPQNNKPSEAISLSGSNNPISQRLII